MGRRTLAIQFLPIGIDLRLQRSGIPKHLTGQGALDQGAMGALDTAVLLRAMLDQAMCDAQAQPPQLEARGKERRIVIGKQRGMIRLDRIRQPPFEESVATIGLDLFGRQLDDALTGLCSRVDPMQYRGPPYGITRLADGGRAHSGDVDGFLEVELPQSMDGTHRANADLRLSLATLGEPLAEGGPITPNCARVWQRDTCRWGCLRICCTM